MLEIKKGEKSFYIGDREEAATAKMAFVLNGEDLVIIDSTFVSEEWKGQGVGKQLLDALVEWARKEDKKILPLCPYAKVQMEKNADYDDMIYRPK